MQSRHGARDSAGDAEEGQSAYLDAIAQSFCIRAESEKRAERISTCSVRHAGPVAA